MEIIVLFLVLFFASSGECLCNWGGYNSTTTVNPVNETNENYTWAVGVPRITLEVNITCHGRFGDDYYLLYLLNSSETFDAKPYFAYIYLLASSFCDLWSENMYATVSSCSITDNYATFYITIDNMTIERNSSELAIRCFWTDDAVYRSQPMILKYCTHEDLPNNLYIIMTNSTVQYAYGDQANVDCVNGDLFLNGIATDMQITCGRYATWEIPYYVCDHSCIKDPDIFEGLWVYPGVPLLPKYRANTDIDLVCTFGRMYFNDAVKSETYFIQSAKFQCEASGNWKYPKVGCWPGHTIDFTSPSITVQSGDAVIVACVAIDAANDVEVIVGSQVIKGKTAWLNLTTTPDLNENTATCRVYNEFGKVVRHYETAIEVLYVPELQTTKSGLNFALQVGNPGRIIVEFRANPSVSLGDVVVMKHGTSIPNYYLVVEGVEHTVVLDFLQVEKSDFGDYVMVVTSYSPFHSTLITNFTLSESPTISSVLTPGDVAAIILSVLIVTALISIAVVLMIRRIRSGGEIKSTNAVEFKTDCHNYEDIKDNRSDGIMQSTSSDYVDMDLGATRYISTQATNQLSTNAWMKPSTDNTNKNPWREGRRPTQENVYGYDN